MRTLAIFMGLLFCCEMAVAQTPTQPKLARSLPSAQKMATQQKIVLEVIVNEQAVGQLFFKLDENNELWANDKTLEKMRLRRQFWLEKKSQ